MKKLILVLLLSISVLLSLPARNVYAQDDILVTKNYTQEEIIFDEIRYKNNAKVTQTIAVSISSYDMPSEEESETLPFISMSEKEFTVKPSKEVSIPFIVSIPKDIKAGTYYNLLTISEKSKKKGEKVYTFTELLNYKYTYNVIEKDSSIFKEFYENTDLSLVLKTKGFPFVFPTEVEYSFKNNSNFAFKLGGSIRVLNQQINKRLAKYELNSEKKIIYPGESVNYTYSIEMYKDIRDIFDNFLIESNTYNGSDPLPVQNRLSVTSVYQIVTIGFILLVIFVGIIWLLISKLLKKKVVKIETVQS